MKKLYQTQQKGFSLVELLVSMSIFTIVVTMAVGTLLVLVDANSKAQNMQDVMTNVTFALDSMTREIRTGTNFAGGGSYISITEGGTSLTAGAGSNQIQYRYNATSKSIDRKLGTQAWFPLTSSDVTITAATFTLQDAATLPGNTEQASVIIYLAGSAGKIDTSDTSFEMQASIVKRVLDL